MTIERTKTGVWFAGGRGSVATTAIVGALAFAEKLADRTGLVSEHPRLAGVALPDFADLVFGGCDTTTTSLVERAIALSDAGVLPAALAHTLAADLAEIDRDIRAVPTVPAARQSEFVARVERDIRDFQDRHHCARVVVVNVSSTEPPVTPDPAHDDLADLERALDREQPVLPASSLYAYAAFRAGCAFADFTPGAGARLPALDQLARRQRLPWAGSDGKTGETLVKSVLAPMFAVRGLRVRSWAGTNLLGGGDGATLADAGATASKSASKARVLREVLGYDVDAPLHIDYIAHLGDWKTAWDHITFEGFLGTRMAMQFTWSGCDSALAAPLVLDLARLLAQAHAVGRVGPQAPLAFFFKDPVATDEHQLAAQFDSLVEWAHDIGGQS